VVIVGAGFAGLAVAKGLRLSPFDVLVVDRNNYHLFTPLLYQVASALLDPSEIAHPIRAVLRRSPNVDVLRAEVESVDVEAHTVRLAGGSILTYDHLVLAAGSVNNYFGAQGWAEATASLKFLSDALRLRNLVLERFEAAAATPDPVRRQSLLSFVIVGGGPTGVEYAGALSELIHGVLKKDYERLDFTRARITLIEAAGTILSPYDAELREAALRTLAARGVGVILQSRLAEILPDRVRLDDGREFAAGTVIWTAGVAAAPLAAQVVEKPGSHGRVPVSANLTLPSHPEVHVIGDMAEAPSPSGPLPMLAPVAIQQGQYLATRLRSLVATAHDPGPFLYRDRGIMATIGRNQAVVQTRHLKLSGLPGWLFWLAVHLSFLIDFRSRAVVLLNWAWEYLFYDRPVRQIVTAGSEPGPASPL
jgi:NADH dehydrogenase